MLTLEKLQKQVEAYRNGEIDFDEFEDWFRTESRGAYESSGQSAAIAGIESALSKFRFQRISETQFREELVNADRPFVLQSDSTGVMVCESPKLLFAATAVAALAISMVQPPRDAVFPRGDGTSISTETVAGTASQETGSATEELPASAAVPA